MLAAMKQNFTRLNDIFFGESSLPSIKSVEDLEHAAEDGASFHFTAYRYSNIGGRKYRVLLGRAESGKLTATITSQAVGDDEDEASDDSDDDDSQGGSEDDDEGFGTSAHSATDAREHVEGNGMDDPDDSGDDNEEYSSSNEDEVEDDFADRLTRVKILKYSGVGIERRQSRRGPARQKSGRRIVKSSTSAEERQDIVAYCVRRAAEMVASSATSIRNAYDHHAEYDLGQHAADLDFPIGWARRPAHGEMYGATYIDPYAQEVVRCFNRGVRTKSEKMSAAQIREGLQVAHPKKYSLPTELEIRKRLSVLFAASKKAGGNEVSADTTAPKRRGRPSVIPDDVVQFIEELLQTTPTLKPKEGLKLVREQFPDLQVPDLDDKDLDKKIVSKISSLKQKVKRDNQAAQL